MANSYIALYSVAIAQGFILVLIMFFYLLKVKNRYSNGGTLPTVCIISICTCNTSCANEGKDPTLGNFVHYR